MGGKIFFSYNRNDSEFALKLAKDLADRGIPIWIDQLDIPPGARWDSAVEKALEGSGSILVVLSPASVASENVLDEVSHALANHKTVYPVIAESCRIPFRLGRFQHIDFTRGYEHALDSLTDAIKASEAPSGVAPPTHPAPAPVPKPQPPFPTKPVIVGAAVVAVLLGLAYFLIQERGPDAPDTGERPTSVPSAPATATAVESDGGPAAAAAGQSAVPRVATAVKLHHRPAVAGTEKAVFFFAKDAWGRVHFNRAALGQSFEGWRDVADNALAVFPPAAATVGAYVYTVMAGTGGEVYLAQGGGNAFTPWSPMGFQTDDAPAVAGTTRHVYFFATHGDDVFYN